jgi:uridine kinase
MTSLIPEVVRRVIALSVERGIVLVAIDGPGGSGKSTLAAAIHAAVRAAGIPASVVSFDEFYLPSAQRLLGSPAEKPIGADYDWPRLRDQVLAPIRMGVTARYDRYDWRQDAFADVGEAKPEGVVIVEGIYSSRRELADLYDLRIWVECPRELRLERGIRRDGEGARGIWENDWMPSEDLYFEAHRPWEYADIIVDGTDE